MMMTFLREGREKIARYSTGNSQTSNQTSKDLTESASDLLLCKSPEPVDVEVSSNHGPRAHQLVHMRAVGSGRCILATERGKRLS